MEATWVQGTRGTDVRWPAVAIAVGSGLAALALHARSGGSATVRLLRRLSLLGTAVCWGNLLFVRSWQQHWGATREEVHRPLPGDALVTHPLLEATRAISIEAPASTVWPWVVRRGLGRAFTVERLEPGGSLVYGMHVGGRTLLSVAYQLEALSTRRSRLVQRVRMNPSLHPRLLLRYLALDFGGLLMARRRLRGIQQRAEREWLATHEVCTSRCASTAPPPSGPSPGSVHLSR